AGGVGAGRGNLTSPLPVGASCPPNPHPRSLSRGEREGPSAAGLLGAVTSLAQRKNLTSGPPSPLRGEGPRVRTRRAGRPRGQRCVKEAGLQARTPPYPNVSRHPPLPRSSSNPRSSNSYVSSVPP